MVRPGNRRAWSDESMGSRGEKKRETQTTTVLLILTVLTPRKPPQFKSRAPASLNVITLSPASLPLVRGALRSLLGYVVSGRFCAPRTAHLSGHTLARWGSWELGQHAGLEVSSSRPFTENVLCYWTPQNWETAVWCLRPSTSGFLQTWVPIPTYSVTSSVTLGRLETGLDFLCTVRSLLFSLTELLRSLNEELCFKCLGDTDYLDIYCLPRSRHGTWVVKIIIVNDS